MPANSVVVWRSCLLFGSETFIRNQGDALRAWRPTYVGAAKVHSALSRDTDVIAFPAGLRGRADYLMLRLTGGSGRLRSRLAALRPDVVHAHFGGDGWLVSRTAAQLGIPLVITLHGRDVMRQPNAPGARGARYRRNLRTAFDRAAVVLAVSERVRSRAIELGADPAKVRVHHTGVPLPDVPPLDQRRDWDVAFVGRFVAKKGVDDLIEALASLPGARALFIGSGPLEPAARDRARVLGLNATFLGHQDPSSVARHLAASRVFAAPSKTAPDGDSEGLPTTILEAAALGLPVVATRHSGIPEAVVDGETGLLGAEGDRAALAEALRRLLIDDALRARLGSAGRRHVETHFDINTQTAQLEQIYDEAHAHGSVPPHRSAGGRYRRDIDVDTPMLFCGHFEDLLVLSHRPATHGRGRAIRRAA